MPTDWSSIPPEPSPQLCWQPSPPATACCTPCSRSDPTSRPFPPFPLLVDAADPEDLRILEAFAKTLSSPGPAADDTTRLKLHLAAALTNNFTNYLYTLAAEYCREEKIDFSLLLPLIRETAERLDRYPPGALQTGPAFRGDRTYDCQPY